MACVRIRNWYTVLNFRDNYHKLRASKIERETENYILYSYYGIQFWLANRFIAFFFFARAKRKFFNYLSVKLKRYSRIVLPG